MATPSVHVQGQAPYFVPSRARWPVVGTLGLFVLAVGASMLLNHGSGEWLMAAGVLLVLYMTFRWFGEVIGESVEGAHNAQVDRSYRWGMVWFIFSEVLFFGCFFGALFYTRLHAVEWLGGSGTDLVTHRFLWPDFEGTWPTNGPAHLGGPFEVMPAAGIPALNTAILLSSGITVTIAHHALQTARRGVLLLFLGLTVLLGCLFIGLQAYEYMHAYSDLNLRLRSGIYGSTFFMLTGFHGLHVTLGAIMLAVIWLRCLRGHFTPVRHFAFEAAAWYWHFVDAVWVGLFIFVYWL